MSEHSDVVEAYARLGASIGAIGRVMIEASRGFQLGLQAGAQAMSEAIARDKALTRARALGTLTPEQRDEQSRIRYADAVKRERKIGRAHVTREALRVRRELGLS